MGKNTEVNCQTNQNSSQDIPQLFLVQSGCFYYLRADGIIIDRYQEMYYPIQLEYDNDSSPHWCVELEDMIIKQFLDGSLECSAGWPMHPHIKIYDAYDSASKELCNFKSLSNVNTKMYIQFYQKLIKKLKQQHEVITLRLGSDSKSNYQNLLKLNDHLMICTASADRWLKKISIG